VILQQEHSGRRGLSLCVEVAMKWILALAGVGLVTVAATVAGGLLLAFGVGTVPRGETA
jgi:hypothetical protein